MAKRKKNRSCPPASRPPLKSLQLNQLTAYDWEIAPMGSMRVPVRFFAVQDIAEALEDRVFQQAANVASLPGIVAASYVMPDAHAGYGFPIGGVAAFDPRKGGVVSAGGVGFDIACGVRTLLTGCDRDQILRVQHVLADTLQTCIPAGVGSKGDLRLDPGQMEAMLFGGARWAVGEGYGYKEDLNRIEESGCMSGAQPEMVFCTSQGAPDSRDGYPRGR